MTKARRSFTDEFKREAVALLQTSGRPLIQIASDLGIQRSMLRNWRDGVPGMPAGVSLRFNMRAVAPAGRHARCPVGRDFSPPSGSPVAALELGHSKRTSPLSGATAMKFCFISGLPRH
jgi:transposase